MSQPDSRYLAPHAFRAPRVVWMIRRHLPAVLAIEAGNFETPWTEKDFLDALRQTNTIGQVAEAGETVAGFVVYETHKDRLTVLNLAVHSAYRRAGIGRALIAKLVDKLSPHRRRKLSIVVRDANLPAQLFLRALGFRAEHVLRRYYDETDEDAYVFVYRPHEPKA